ncbi:hypothetical protein [Hymenobacter cheonanensis]|uniref:hypothetical protein n=1 Tax=Hymenobacter sp. CA2-7 TaxID=3063993 RepID=UPI002712B9EC|nr:hypothetical protein [Hymenobacter sp. CA2-7]MDO7884230.1 hypothetical protein [Hymenobacter sp. CA2-7]
MKDFFTHSQAARPGTWWLIGLAKLLASTHAYGQGTIGFSSQTQPSQEIETQWLSQKAFNRFHNRVDYGHCPDSLKLTYSPSVPATGIGIGNAKTLLTEFDNLETVPEARTGLGNWVVGIVSDGDFNKTISTPTTTGKTGSLGVDAVFMKPTYLKYTYTNYQDRAFCDGSEPQPPADAHLVGYRTVSHPRVAISTLVVLFSGAGALSTGVAKAAKAGTVASAEQRRIFGQALLIPNGYVVGNGLSFASNLTYYFGKFGTSVSAENDIGESNRLGMSLSLVAVQTNWSSRDSTTTLNILAPSIGLVYKLVEGRTHLADKDLFAQVQPFARYTLRHLFGDVQSNTAVLAEALGSSQRTYHALDFGVTLSVNAVRLTTNVPIFFGPKIPGFSQGQLVAGFGLAASIPVSN